MSMENITRKLSELEVGMMSILVGAGLFSGMLYFAGYMYLKGYFNDFASLAPLSSIPYLEVNLIGLVPVLGVSLLLLLIYGLIFLIENKIPKFKKFGFIIVSIFLIILVVEQKFLGKGWVTIGKIPLPLTLFFSISFSILFFLFLQKIATKKHLNFIQKLKGVLYLIVIFIIFFTYIPQYGSFMFERKSPYNAFLDFDKKIPRIEVIYKTPLATIQNETRKLNIPESSFDAFETVAINSGRVFYDVFYEGSIEQDGAHYYSNSFDLYLETSDAYYLSPKVENFQPTKIGIDILASLDHKGKEFASPATANTTGTYEKIFPLLILPKKNVESIKYIN